MITKVQPNAETFGNTINQLSSITNFKDEVFQKRMPALSLEKVQITDNSITVAPRGGFEIAIPENIANEKSYHINFEIKATNVEEITHALNSEPLNPILQESGRAEFEGIVVKNINSDTELPIRLPEEKLKPVESKNVLFAIMADGSEKLIETNGIFTYDSLKINLPLSEYQGIQKIAVRNVNTSKTLI